MFIAKKDTKVIAIHETEWQCRRKTKGMTKPEYWEWLATITSGDPPVVDYSGETGYTIVECTDEDVQARLRQLDDYVSSKPEGITYNIKYYASKRDAEEILDIDGKSHDPKQYVSSHFVPDDSAKNARLLADEWERIRTQRNRLLADCDWTQASDSPLSSSKKTEWGTYRTTLRNLPADQSSKTTYADIEWPAKP